ncbi:MAG: hypothetical protein Q4C55_06530, partial [Eubacterium sp.]|nr:hypothetical protein [Eubacterium sp.]
MEAAVYDIGMAAGVAFILCLGFLCLKKGFEPRFSEAGTLLCQGAIMLGSALTLLFSVKYFLAAASAYIVLAFFVQALGLFKARTSGELTRPGAAAMLSAAMLFLEVTAALSYLLYDAGYMAEGVTAKKLFFLVSVWAILGIGFYKSLKE